MFSSCFAGARFTRLLRAAPERASPQAVTAELAAITARFRAAFTSRSTSKPQSAQRNVLSAKASVSLMTPQQEQVLLEGNQRLATTNREPYSRVLYSSWRRNLKETAVHDAASEMAIACHAAYVEILDADRLPGGGQPGGQLV